MQVDFKDHELVFPPAICATSLRPDAVLWSIMSHVVILLELTCCAEEGFSAAHLRKESRYAGLLQEINESKTWKASLLTLEVGARGLVSPRTFRAFTSLGFSTVKAKQICKELSEVVVRCSIGIYGGYANPVWPHEDLVSPQQKKKSEQSEVKKAATKDPQSALATLRAKGIKTLYHFTDQSNVASIRIHGLMSASTLVTNSIASTMNSDEASRQLDAKAGLENYVRLSFCEKNPMLYVSLNEGRISKPVMLQVRLEALAKNGVLFSDCNATRLDASVSEDPIVRFDVVKAKTQYDVAKPLRQFYQAEVGPFVPQTLLYFQIGP